MQDDTTRQRGIADGIADGMAGSTADERSTPKQWTTPASPSSLALVFAAVLVACGIALRAKLNFSSTLAPAMDAGYYPLQAWWLLEHGRPMYDDVPLFFIVNAVVGKAIAGLTGMDLGDALMLASRWIDCVVPPLIAVPIMLLAAAWSEGRRTGLVIGVLVSAAAIANPLTLRMLGDFQKNSMALVFLACAAWAAHRAATMPKTRSIVARFWPLALFTGLCAFTHVGGFGAAAVMLGTTAIAWFVLSGRITAKKLALGTAGLAIAAAVAFAIIAIFAPDRADDLLDAPRRLFGGGGGGGGGGPGAMGGAMGPGGMGGPMGAGMGVGPPGGGMGGGRPGGPPGGGQGSGTVLIYAIAILAIARACFDRSLAAGDRALGLGLAACAMLLACPLLAGEYAMRLSLMAFAPAALAAVFVLAPLARRPRAWTLGVAGALAASALALSVVAGQFVDARGRGGRGGPDGLFKGPVIPEGSDAELIAMRPLIADPAKTLVVARHGLQWWAGHLLHTPVRNTVPDDAFTKYDRVLQLVEVGGRGGPQGFGGPRGFGGPQGPDGGGGFDGPPRRGGFGGPDGPPGFGADDGPPLQSSQRGVDSPMGRPRPANVPRGEPSVPRGEPSVPRGEPSVPRGEPSVPRGEPSVPRGEPRAQDRPRGRGMQPNEASGARDGTVLFEGSSFRLIELKKPSGS
jgi:hypothetical protein